MSLAASGQPLNPLPHDSPARFVWRATLLFVLLLLPVTLVAAWTLNRYEQLSMIERLQSETLRSITSQTGRLETVLSALNSMHYVSPTDDGGVLVSLAEELRADAPQITALGRYHRVTPEQRADFEGGLAERGLYDFRVHDLGPTGVAIAAPRDRLSWPIAMLEPMAPSTLRLLGADLAAVPGLSEALHRASVDNRSLLSALPPGWGRPTELMLFRPVYRGYHAPRSDVERLAQSDGGYWLLLDGQRLVDAVPERLSLRIETVSGPGQRHTLLQRASAERPPRWYDLLYAPSRTAHEWHFGDTRLVVTLEARLGVERRVLAFAYALLALMAAMLALRVQAARQRFRTSTERHRSQVAIFVERERAERTLDAISDAVITLDSAARVRHVNPAAARLMGATREFVLHGSLDDLLRLNIEGGGHFDPRAAIDALPDTGKDEFVLVPAEPMEHDVTLHASLSRAPSENGDRAETILVLRDTSAERRFTRELEHQANHDALTGCTNRHHFEQRLRELDGTPDARQRGYALLYMDLDQFKIVNDTAGHAAGDRLLVELTANLRALVRRGDVLSRLGGDEFGLIVIDVDRAGAQRVANSIYRLFQSIAFVHETRAFAVRASLGLVHVSEIDGGVEELLAAADIACYAAKDKGRNELVEYRAGDESMVRRSSELDWLPRLQAALDNDGFHLCAQPIMRLDAPAGGIEHAELLLRLHDEDGQDIAPWQIVQAAERYGIMRQIDRWVIARALSHAAAFKRAGHRLSFSINLSGQSAADASLIDYIEAQYRLHAVDPALIWFEITETAAISHFATAVELANGIRRLGSRIALDDFGSGLSSFGYLKNLPVDVLKIDGQFVREMASNAIDREMVRAIAQIACAMGIDTVAEFVEDAATKEALRALGIDYAQGYHIARPMPIDELEARLQAAGSLPRAA